MVMTGCAQHVFPNISHDVVARWTHLPFGQTVTAETGDGSTENPFRFTGQYLDSEIEQYYLRARQYDLPTMRFMSRDPAIGDFQEPLTLHRYLYCANDPVNRIDTNGRLFSSNIGAVGGIMALFSGIALPVVTLMDCSVTIKLGIAGLGLAGAGLAIWDMASDDVGESFTEELDDLDEYQSLIEDKEADLEDILDAYDDFYDKVQEEKMKKNK